MNGLLLVDKPKTWTSFDVVNKIRRELSNSPLAESARKRFPVGHTGTLDPLASGLLVLVIGSYTKRAGELSKLDKVYQAAIRLGQTSTTDDDEGDKTAVTASQPAIADIKQALAAFTGVISQTPPAYSAIKVAGQRAYKLARQGKVPDIKPRRVTIHRLELLSYEYPRVQVRAEVSSGTYIRTLARDIGETLQTGAYLADLRRLSVGQWSVDNAVAPDVMASTIQNRLVELP